MNPAPSTAMRTLPLACALFLGLGSCGTDEPTTVVPTVPAEVLAMFRIEPASPDPDTPLTPAKVALGNKLYHDSRLSPDGSVSCATCHDLKTFGVDHQRTSKGFKGQRGTRNAPTTVDAFKQIAQFWDGRAATVEEQAVGPILNPIEHGFAQEAQVTAILAQDPKLVAEFKATFPDDPDPVSLKNVGRAIGAFERTLSSRSRFDEFLDGDLAALNAAEKQGLLDFVTTGCTTCHMTRMVGGQMYQKIGLLHPYETEDTGRHQATKREQDIGFFKVPSLRNVAHTGPYLHDGSAATLEEVVRLMAWHQLGKRLQDEQVASIVTFLRALTGELSN